MFIYSIRCKNDDSQIYIGSTKTSVSRRGTVHKSCCKRHEDSPLYNHINSNGGWDNYYIELYEEFTGTLDQLKKREGELIRQFKQDPNMVCINHNIAGRTPLQNMNEKYKTNPDYRIKCKEYSKKQYKKLKSSLSPPAKLVEEQILLGAYSTLLVIAVVIFQRQSS